MTRHALRATTYLLALCTSVLVGAVGIASPAIAHSQLLATSPAADSTARAPADEVTLTFNEPVKARFSTVAVTGPEGLSYSRYALRVVDNVVHQAVYPLRSGTYQVAWRVVSADGHPVSGEFRFTVALPPGHEPMDPPPQPTAVSQPSGPSVWAAWLWVVTVAAVLVLGLIFLLVVRRRTR